VITGGVRSVIQVIVLDAVAVLPQPSMAVHVLVCERSHPLEQQRHHLVQIQLVYRSRQ
jgi:hypothetical protein